MYRLSLLIGGVKQLAFWGSIIVLLYFIERFFGLGLGFFVLLFILFLIKNVYVIRKKKVLRVSVKSLVNGGLTVSKRKIGWMLDEKALWKKGVLSTQEVEQLVWSRAFDTGIFIFFCSFPRNGIQHVSWFNVNRIIILKTEETTDILAKVFLKNDSFFYISWDSNFGKYVPDTVGFDK